MKAKSLLVEDYTCILIKGDVEYKLKLAGINPMLSLLEKKVPLQGFSLADKIVGKAAAMIICYAGINNVYAQVISKDGYKYLFNHGVYVEYDIMVNKIVNRTGTDICPMEKTVQNIEDYTEGYEILVKKAKELSKKK